MAHLVRTALSIFYVFLYPSWSLAEYFDQTLLVTWLLHVIKNKQVPPWKNETDLRLQLKDKHSEQNPFHERDQEITEAQCTTPWQSPTKRHNTGWLSSSPITHYFSRFLNYWTGQSFMSTHRYHSQSQSIRQNTIGISVLNNKTSSNPNLFWKPNCDYTSTF